MAILSLSTAPEREPITLDEVKAYLRIDEGDDYTHIATVLEDGLLNNLITAARQYTENLCGPLITQTWVQYEDNWPDGMELELWKPRVQSVTSITYVDDSAANNTFSSTYYDYDTSSQCRGRVVLKNDYTWPTDRLYTKNPIAVTFTCGYGDDATDVPEPLRLALLFLVTHWYEERNLVVTDYRGPDLQTVPMTVDALLANYRHWVHT